MTKNSRIGQILNYMSEHNNTASVAELCSYFQVSDMTIRRDLQELERNKKLIRHHGGASLLSHSIFEVSAESLQTRLHTNFQSKMAIGKMAALYLNKIAHSGRFNSVFLASGSTMCCMTRNIDYPMDNITIVTDNLEVSQILAPKPDYTVIFAGGQLILPSLNAVGQMAEKMIRSFTYDFAFIGSAAIDSDGNSYTYNLLEAGTFQAIIESSKHVIVLADSEKICKKTFVQLFQLQKNFTLITNQDIPESFSENLKKNGVEIITENTPLSEYHIPQ